LCASVVGGADVVVIAGEVIKIITVAGTAERVAVSSLALCGEVAAIHGGTRIAHTIQTNIRIRAIRVVCVTGDVAQQYGRALTETAIRGSALVGTGSTNERIANAHSTHAMIIDITEITVVASGVVSDGDIWAVSSVGITHRDVAIGGIVVRRARIGDDGVICAQPRETAAITEIVGAVRVRAHAIVIDRCEGAVSCTALTLFGTRDALTD